MAKWPMSLWMVSVLFHIIGPDVLVASVVPMILGLTVDVAEVAGKIISSIVKMFS